MTLILTRFDIYKVGDKVKMLIYSRWHNGLVIKHCDSYLEIQYLESYSNYRYTDHVYPSEIHKRVKP